MKILNLIAVCIAISSYSFAQHDKVLVGEYCYYEQINGQKSEANAMPYTYHERLELKFISGYQITIKDRNNLAHIIKPYSSNDLIQKTLLGSYKPESINKEKKIIDVKSEISLYWDGTNIIIEIPELTDFMGGGVAPNHSIFIPSQCIPDFIKCIEG